MKRCPICYERINDTEDYSQRGLRLLSPQLKKLSRLSLSADEQRQEVIARVGQMSIQGVQKKPSAKLQVKAGRFDRIGHNKKLAVEDFAQLSGGDRHTKYNSSMEKVVAIIEQFCTFPKVELLRLFKLTIFNFLIGNEDMHLKNFSLITLSSPLVSLRTG